jgi:crotonobetainyl-CoA:carnitine CoA-transferase CaiB-like acyl-CoA transferase
MGGLSELRVLDFSTEIAGPYATKLFSDAGADVIKVESPSGDPLRATGGRGRRPLQVPPSRQKGHHWLAG